MNLGFHVVSHNPEHFVLLAGMLFIQIRQNAIQLNPDLVSIAPAFFYLIVETLIV